ncbi:FimV/HubP family polar landmark protein [Microbulbifer variabilis]|uniref:FimV/HubP family polar landmark protein n=1 Tax=Microbulbifer variabilis TaxID=266805 RepID=UPI0003669F66|nr:FimV/HubP family polar landmark protein [Microbulbifer variabilis]
MRVRKLALAVGLVGALGSNAALALGLGEIKLNSTLNQPLNAEIGLLQTRGLNDTEIKVRLAGPDEFNRAGVERAYLLTSLRFDVDYSGAKPVIRITSREPIREPFLNFLVETRWPSGRLLREYTLLMDLPAFSPNTAQQPVRAAERERQQVRRDTPVQRPAQRPLQPAQQPTVEPDSELVGEPATAQQSEPVRRQPQRASSVEDAGSNSQVYGPVSSADTLWEIALENRVGREFSVQQTMLAIQRLNPEAFINDNINLLKKGAVLRLPNADDLRSLSLTEAISEVAQQNDSWRQRTGAEDIAAAAPLDARAVVEETVANDVVEGRVSLAAPGDNESVTSGSGSGAEDSEALDGDLTVAEEELDKSQLENTELRERIAELDEQIDTMEALVDVSNEEMRAVQAAAEQSDPLLDPSEIDSAEIDTVQEEMLAASEGESLDTAEQPEVETAAVEPEARNRVVSVQTKSEPTLMERLGDNMQFIGIGAAGLLVGIFGFFTWRRRKAEQEAEQQLEQEMAAERAPIEIPMENAEPDETLAAVESMEADDTFDLGDLGDVGTDDPISEAEIHLSLGQYEEAEAKLLQGLEKDPQVVDARLMLMEVYAHHQDVEKFDEHYLQLLSISDGPVADRAARLRETIAGAPDFEAPSMDFSSESLEAAQLDDIGAALDQDFSSAEPSTLPADDFSSDTSLLDDLTMDLSLGDEKPVGADSEQELSLDLDLDTSFDESVSGTDPASDLESEFNLDDLDLNGALENDAQLADSETPLQADNDLSLDDLDLGELDLGDLNSEAGDLGEPTVKEASGDELAIDAFDSAELDLDSLELESDSAEPAIESAAAEASEAKAGGSIGGLDFELDLSMMDGEDEVKSIIEEPQAEEPAAELDQDLDLDAIDMDLADLQSPAGEADLSLEEFSEGELEMIGGELDSELDLDNIDLDDIAADLSSPDELAVEAEAVSSESAELDNSGDLSLETDLELDMASLEATGEELSLGGESIEEEFSLEDELALIDESTDGDLTLETGADLGEGAIADEPGQLEAMAEKEQSGGESEFADLDFNLESDLNSELSLLEGGDEMGTKLELAQAYLDMGDKEGAKDILKEVAQDGGGEHRNRAEEMLERMV